MARHLPDIARAAFESGPARDFVPVSYTIEWHNRASAKRNESRWRAEERGRAA